jgi:hypothetical protein
MLTARISGLEGLVVGAGQTTSPEQLKVKIQSIIDEVGAVESKVPHLKVCRELCKSALVKCAISGSATP